MDERHDPPGSTPGAEILAVRAVGRSPGRSPVVGVDRSGWDDRYDTLNATRVAAVRRARATWRGEDELRPDWPGGIPRECGVPVARGRWAGQPCRNVAGHETVHRGYGPCFAHGGAKMRGRAEGAWLMAHGFAQQLDVDPWDALLTAVKIAAGKVAYCEWVIGQAKTDLELEGRVRRVTSPGGESQTELLVHPDTGEPLGVGAFRDLHFWVTKSELWTERLARWAKMAVDAGVEERRVRIIEDDARQLAGVLNTVLGQLEEHLTPELVAAARSTLRRELLALDAAEQHRRTDGQPPPGDTEPPQLVEFHG